jgi:hypothetical protein
LRPGRRGFADGDRHQCPGREAEKRGAVKALRDWMSFARSEIESLPEGERRAEADLMIEGMAAHAQRIESGEVAP